MLSKNGSWYYKKQYSHYYAEPIKSWGIMVTNEREREIYKEKITKLRNFMWIIPLTLK